MCKPSGDMSDNYSNGIADSWELQYSLQYLDPAQDNEGAGLAASPGDGYTAFDEYRGFVVVDPVAGRSLLRSDPVQNRDVFFYDQAGAAPYITSGDSDSLSQQTSAVGLRWHQIYDDGISFGPPINGQPYTNQLPHNRNSATATAAPTFAIVYLNQSLGGALGRSNGFCVNGVNPILLDMSAIQTTIQFNRFDPNRSYKYTAAHETSHKLGLEHHYGTYTWDSRGPGIPSGSLIYGTEPEPGPPANTLYLWVDFWQWPPYTPLNLDPKGFNAGDFGGKVESPIYGPGAGAFASYLPQFPPGPTPYPPGTPIASLTELQYSYVVDGTNPPQPLQIIDTTQPLYQQILTGYLMDFQELPANLYSVGPQLTFEQNDMLQMRPTTQCRQLKFGTNY